ncbi:MAG: hypothetical protein WC782_05605 [Methylococcaceae bacterium]|jgi:DamX protein
MNMAELDTFTYQKSGNAEAKKSAGYFLITQERTQKLELLTHLIVNLSQTLVVCGPDGIGKTTFLGGLQAQKIVGCEYCFIQGHADLSFEAIHNQLAQKAPLKNTQALATPVKKTVLILDNAGALVPGLIASLIQYAAANQQIRLVLALTPDELHIKSSSDPAIDQCHFIELLPLTEKQCGEFLQYLAIQASTQMPLTAISDALITKIYHDSHGIPGRIIAKLPNLPVAAKNVGVKWLLYTSVAALIALALMLQWLGSAKYGRHQSVTGTAATAGHQLSPVPTEPPLGNASLAAMPNEKANTQYQSPILLGQSEHSPQDNEALVDGLSVNAHEAEAPEGQEDNQQLTAKNTPKSLDQAASIDKAKPATDSEIDPKRVTEQGLAAVNTPIKTGVSSSNGETWLAAQSDKYYTLQLMVLTKQKSAEDVLRKYPALSADLGYIKKTVNGLEKYILFYGAYENAGQASSVRQTLPLEFRKSVPRNISSLKKELAQAKKTSATN